MAEPVLILVAVSSVIGSLVYLFKNIKKCRGPCCECYQNTDTNHVDVPSPTLEETSEAMKTSRLQKVISRLSPRRAKPRAFMPSPTPRGQTGVNEVSPEVV